MSSSLENIQTNEPQQNCVVVAENPKNEVFDQLSIRAIALLSVVDPISPTAEHSEYLIAEGKVYGKNDYCATMVFQGTDLVDCRSFRLAIAKYLTGISLRMSGKDYFDFCSQLRNSAEQRICFRYAGHNETIWCMTNAFVDYANQKIEEKHKTQVEKEWKSLENSYVYCNSDCMPILYPAMDVVGTMLKCFRNLLSSYANPCVICCIGIMLGVCFWDIFQKDGQGFPIVILTGESQSGKTTLLKIVAAMYGLFGHESFVGGHSTNASVMRLLGMRNNIPLLMNEIEEGGFVMLETLVKAIFDKTSRFKCAGETIDTSVVRTSLIGTSNYFFSRLAPELVSRVVWADMKKNEFAPENFAFFDDEKLQELSNIIPKLLCYRKAVPTIFHHIYSELLKRYANCDTRQMNNIAISCTMWHLVNLVCAETLVDISNLAQKYVDFYALAMENEQKGGDVILQEIATMVEQCALEYDREYALVGTRLKLRMTLFIGRRNTFFCCKKALMTKGDFLSCTKNDERFDLHTENHKPVGRCITIEICECEYLLELVSARKAAKHPFSRVEAGGKQ